MPLHHINCTYLSRSCFPNYYCHDYNHDSDDNDSDGNDDDGSDDDDDRIDDYHDEDEDIDDNISLPSIHIRYTSFG